MDQTTTMDQAATMDQYFGATTYFDKDNNHIVAFVAGSKDHVIQVIDDRIRIDNQKKLIDPFLNNDGIDLRKTANAEFIQLRNRRVMDARSENKIFDNEYNTQLKIGIKSHNKCHPNDQRSYADEKWKTPLVKKSGIRVKFLKLSVVYTMNPYVSFDEVVQIILNTIEVN